jgi:hypothetical protein
MQPHLTTAGPRHGIIAGMPRAGTTYLYHAFATHPGAFVPYRKELRFFSSNYHRGTAWYTRFFAGTPADLLRVDASPDYFMDTSAPFRIRDFSPETKVVLGVREPAAWAVSLHRQLRTIEHNVPPFADFLAGAEYPDFAFFRKGRTPKLRFSLQSGFVQRQLRAFCDALGARLLLYDFAWFEHDPLAVMQALESFLGLTPFFSQETLPSGRINARARKSSRWLGYLTSRDTLIDTAGLIVPRRLLIALRMKVDRVSAAGDGPAQSAVDATDLGTARIALTPDLAYIKSLFATCPLVLGDGRPYRSGP